MGLFQCTKIGHGKLQREPMGDIHSCAEYVRQCLKILFWTEEQFSISNSQGLKKNLGDYCESGYTVA